MIKTIINTFKALSTSDQILLCVALFILISPNMAVFAAVIVVGFFVYKFGKAIAKADKEE